MKTITFKSIRTRLTYWFLLLTLIPLLIILVVTYNQEKRTIEKDTYNKLTAIRDLKVQQVETWLDERLGDLQVSAGDFEIRGLDHIFAKTTRSQEDVNKIEIANELLNRYLRNYDDYGEIFIIDANTGVIELSSNNNSVGNNKSQDSYFTVPIETGEIYIKDIYYSQTTHQPEMTISMPISCFSHGEHIIGIIVVRINPENSLYSILSNRVGLGDTGETLIVNKDVVALNELRWYENAPLNLQIYAEPAVNAASGETGITKTNDYRNEKILAAYTYIPRTEWGFIAKQDLNELNAPIREMINNFLIIFLVAGIIITLIALRVSKSISKPIIEMNNVARKFGSGDFSIRNKYTSEDEIGSLAREFNNMADLTESRNIIQTGVVDISKNIIGNTSMQDFGNSLLQKMMEITRANMSTFYILNELTSEYEHFTSIGANKDLLRSFSSQHPEGEFGNAVSKKEIFYLRNISEDTIFKFVTTAGELIPKEIITIPIITDNVAVALISLISNTTFSIESYSTIEQSWIAINSIYTNLMANERTRILSEHLSRTNQQLEAQTEELQEQSEEMQSQSEELQQSSEELQEQNQELEMQRMQVEEANRLKSEFLSNMSHELRTPLNSIMALSRVLIMQAKNKLTDEENNYLEIVERNGKQLLKLINDILDLSKIEAGKMEVNPKSMSLKTLLQDIKDNLQPISNEKGLEFELNIANVLPQIETDEGKLHQILQNIVGNAVKFTEKGKVEINVNSNADNVLIQVIDTGIGIPADALLHIFEEFRQVDGTSSRSYEGTGLGLAIAHKLIKILGGNINAESRLGKGSTFTITLPIKWQGEAQLQSFQTFKPVTHKSDDKTILVVDDDPKFVNKISDYLNVAGYKTISAYSGKEALKLAEEYQPFAITLDVMMPTMDGWEVLQKLKSKLVTKDIPVIVVSVSEDNKTGFALGAVGYVQKPVDKYLLISEINKLHNKPNSVMIVDDNKIDRKQMSQIIQAENIKTILANDGNECISLIQQSIPDVLVLDLMMPEMDGFQVLDRIRKDQKTRNLPVIVVTAKDLTREDKSKLSGKVSSVLAKSESTPQDLFKEISRILNRLEQKEIESEKDNSEKRILVVEDNDATVIQMKAILEHENYIVEVASDGLQALEHVKHTIPDGIILDLMMPEMDGFEVLESIRSTDTTKQIPILILTAKDLTKKDLSKLSTNNVQQLVQKGDVDVDGLLLKVKMMLGNGTYEQQEDRKKGERGKPEKTGKQKKIIDGVPNILVVEDNPDNMITIKAIIGNDYNIWEAMDGEEGLHRIANDKPDLVLMDISLPKMDGMEVVTIIRETENLKDIPMIAVTAKAMKEDKDIIMNAGFDDYITKPIDQKLLLKTIKKWLGK